VAVRRSSITVAKAGWFGLLRVESVILVVLITAASSAMFTEVIMRYVFEKPILGLEHLAGFTAVTLYFIGGAYATYERSNIKAELTELFLKSHQVKITRAVAAIISLGLCSYACTWAYNFVEWGIVERPLFTTFYFPKVYLMFGVLVGLVLMSVYFLAESIDNVKAVLESRKQRNRGK